MEAGDEKFFSKSGNRVRLIEELPRGLWEVERIDGASKGKRLLCSERTLVDSLDGTNAPVKPDEMPELFAILVPENYPALERPDFEELQRQLDAGVSEEMIVGRAQAWNMDREAESRAFDAEIAHLHENQ